MAPKSSIPASILVRIEVTVPAEHVLTLSEPEGQGTSEIVAGAAGHVVELVKARSDLGPGDEIVACLTRAQKLQAEQGEDVSVAAYVLCSKPSQLSAKHSADLVTQFLAAAALLDRSSVLDTSRLADRPWYSSLEPNNVVLMVRESKTSIVLVQLLCHLFPGVDIFFCYHEGDKDLARDYQNFYFLLPLESGAKASARYPPNSKEDLAGYFRANAEAYTRSSNIGLAIDTAGMMEIKPEVRDLVKDESKCYQDAEPVMEMSKLPDVLNTFSSLVEGNVIRPVVLKHEIESYQ